MSTNQVRRQYKKKFKREAIRQVKLGKSIAVATKVLGIATLVRHLVRES